MQDFYDGLSPFYHLIYPDWHASIDKQGAELASLIRERWGSDVQKLLDVSCGIGTQALGLASQGFDVVASDLSKESIARARSEAKAKGLHIPFSVCDMREIQSHHQGGFDVVLSADNSMPHLLTDEDILQALRGMYGQLNPGGGCLITVRDYEQVELGKGLVKPYGVREENG
ncbi:class I SAM-dependent methyltransferase, partial [Ferrimonas gelatinilytica]|uniref:class I SAM-dependent methyltransferase n=1 Tax=Ferrimonas gelatinilytica TaxID=1255257 RepID=UPI0031F15B43